jgi:hypothetical protein
LLFLDPPVLLLVRDAITVGASVLIIGDSHYRWKRILRRKNSVQTLRGGDERQRRREAVETWLPQGNCLMAESYCDEPSGARRVFDQNSL